MVAMAVGASKTMSSVLFILSAAVMLFGALSVGAQSGFLPKEEVEALKEIANQLGKTDWDFSLNPCDGNSNWLSPRRYDMPMYNNTLICNCSYPGGVCHVQQLYLKGQDLAGVLPPSLAKLTYLTTIDLSRNYLSGTIPPEWASMSLQYMSAIVNRLSGPIPKYIGNITSLIYMSFEDNMFSGSIPSDLGKLHNLENLIFSANNLTGVLPSELNKLSNLTELRLSSNNFSGKLPIFGSWTQLQKLELQGSGFEGPIPANLSLLSNLQELRISDLTGGDSEFPNLENMKGMSKLMLRSCNLSGIIPPYIASLPYLKDLDLSFNNLEGEVPDLSGLRLLEYLYLTGNSFNGSVPDWIKDSNDKLQIDLSYNDFKETTVPTTCRETLNLFRSFSSADHSMLAKCLFPCPQDHYQININCGGPQTTVGSTIFDADENSAGAAKFVPNSEYYWGTSISGNFWDTNASMIGYTATNLSSLTMDDPQLYTTARLSPLSLTYYGRCLANGNYTVRLHFAEIVFRGNRSYQSLGKRVFDIYIQGVRMRKDFNIEDEANGVDKAVIQEFKATVTNKTLEIRFQYAGKGTTAVPQRGNYGPLISAISIKSDFDPPIGSKKKTVIALTTAAAALCLIFTSILIAWWKGCFGDQISREQDLRGIDLQTGLFTFRQMKAATDNFAAENKIGEGGFGSVYKGTLLDGTVIAVKQLSARSKQGSREFVNEIGMIAGLQHPNLVKLYGCCVERNQLLLVYEYLENNSLARALFGPEKLQLNIDWPTRQRICIGIAKGLAYLHEESIIKIVHRDIKATNVLLDRDLNPKISDFGLAKLDDDDENTHISTRIAGTVGYMAPEYAMWGYLTYKADVYSFGVVALEIVSGKNNMKYRPSEDYVCLLDWAFVLQQKGALMELVDPRLGSDYNKTEALRMIKIALLCTYPSPALRPTMSAVVSMLQGHTKVQELNMDPSLYGDDFKFQFLREKSQSSSETESLIRPSGDIEMNGYSTTSYQDLYPASQISLPYNDQKL